MKARVASLRPLLALFLATVVVGCIGLAGLTAIVGPSVVVHWVWTHIVPSAAMIGVILGAFWLLARVIGDLPDPPNRDWYQ